MKEHKLNMSISYFAKDGIRHHIVRLWIDTAMVPVTNYALHLTRGQP